MSRQRFFVSSLFFLFYLGFAVWWPFLNLYLKDINLSGAEIGLISGVYQAMIFVVVPLAGLLADRYGSRKILITLGSISAVLIIGLRFLPSFWWFLIFMPFLAFMHHPLGSLIDTIAVDFVRRSRYSFGAVRMWGSLGWALGSVLMGRFLLVYPTSSIFFMAVGFYVLAVIASFGYREDPIAHDANSQFGLSNVKKILDDKRTLFFLILLVFYGIGVSPVYVFINLYFRDIGATNQQIGFAFALQALSEIPLFFVASWFIKKIGVKKMLLGAMLVSIVRMFVYGMIGNPTIAILFSIFQGFNFSLFWVGITDVIHKIIPKKNQATAQALIWAFHLGGGVTIGNMTIGFLSDFYSIRFVMVLFAIFTCLVFAGMFIYFKRYQIDGHNE